MALRYVAIVDAHPDHSRELSAHINNHTGLREIHASSRLTLLADDPDELVRPASRDVHVIGHLFNRAERPARVRVFDDAAAAAIRSSAGDALVRDYWGGYCAFIENANGAGVIIQRDPSGLMPCFYIQVPGATLVASDVETLLEANLLPIEIDWPALAAQMAAIDFPFSRTALAGVTELLAGHRMTIADAPDVRPCWSPWDHIRPVHRPEDLPGLLYETVNSTLVAWGSCFDCVLLGVSGGLDSSIVAAGLANSGCELAAYTIATREAGGDERSYARTVTRSLGIPLAELFHDQTVIDFLIPTGAHLPRPAGGAFGQSHTLEQLALGDKLDAGAYFTGIGGDNVFCFMQSATPFLDRLTNAGPTMDAVRTLLDICKLTDCSVWDVLAMANRKRRQGNTYRWPVAKRRFLAAEPAFKAVPMTHPWLDTPPDALPGKAVHIAMLARVQATLDSFPRQKCAPQIHPLLSQPVIELCLQIPTWEWCAGGQNRAVARRAFAKQLPAEILARRSKGSPDSFAFDVLQAKRTQIRDFLIGGQLDQNGLLDRQALDTALRTDVLIVAPDHVYLYALAESEAWVRTWQQRAISRSMRPQLAKKKTVLPP